MSSAAPMDTIVAVSSPPGSGATALLRISGSGALPAVRSVCFRGGELLENAPGPGGASVSLRVEGCELAAWVQVFKAPRSYTREDVVEVLVPGSPPLVRALVTAILAQGRGSRPVRLAQPGEFTLRAFLHGRIDLSQAEAVAALIGASGEAEALASRRGLRGELGRQFQSLATAILELTGLIEAGLDFPDEELPLVEDSTVARRIARLESQLEELAGSVAARVPDEGSLRVVLAGFPNAGKSSLLNALLGRPAAITSDLPGTTRDPVRGRSRHRGREIEWIDLAGGRSHEWFAPGDAEVFDGAEDPIQKIVGRLTRIEMEHADRVLWVVDPLDRPEASLAVARKLSSLPLGIVAQKADLVPLGERRLPDGPGDLACGPFWVSARTGEGLRELLEAGVVPGRDVAEAGVGAARTRPVSAHQEAVIVLVREALRRARAAVEEGELGLEFVASDLREARIALDEGIGVRPRETILEWIFSRFCIGK